MKINIHGEIYDIADNEFNLTYPELLPMKPKKDIAELDREISFIKKLTMFSDNFTNIGLSFGSYVPKNLQTSYTNIYINPESINNDSVLRLETSKQHSYSYSNPIIISSDKLILTSYTEFTFINKYVYVNENYIEKFITYFNYCIDNNNITYDNLINILFMVKNAGDTFKNVLEKNMGFADKITILDTGSTDDTINIITEFFNTNKINGTLYQRPWKNFRDSRNELLELAGDNYVFNIMLDDTYILNGNIREFLTIARSDDEADSYSIFIQDSFVRYSSNRITKPFKKLKYIYTIHEIIEPNKNFEIPADISFITDEQTPYMTERTNNRKLNDLKLLFEEHKNNPNDCRQLYYIAETYLCLKDWENSILYYEKRSKAGSFKSEPELEVQDSLYKIAVISYFNLNIEWETCYQLFLNCYNYDTTKSEPLYIIGYHYNTINDHKNAYTTLCKAFELSKQYNNSSMNSKYKINLYDIPKSLLKLCLIYNNYKLGFECASICNNFPEKEQDISYWLSTFYLCNQSNNYLQILNDKKMFQTKKTICFVAPGGWEKWDGETLVLKGLGGTETCIIRFAEELTTIHGNTHNIIIFCNCKEEDIPKNFKNVLYININSFPEFISKYYIDVCFVNRLPEYLQVCIQNNIKNIYLVLHDLLRDIEIIPIHNNLKKIICLTDWHKQQVLNVFPDFKEKTTVMSYAIDTSNYFYKYKQPYSFIFPSFPNRGLLPLLQMFPKIVEKYPKAILHVFCNTKMDWVQQNYKEQMDLIDELLKQPNVINHGWVSSETLNLYWSLSEILFYPCTFKETYCRVALEAAASKTLVVTNNLAALNETVGDRGVIIPGDASTPQWQDLALTQLFNIMEDQEKKKDYITRNYEWALTKSYNNIVNDFSNTYIVNK